MLSWLLRLLSRLENTPEIKHRPALHRPASYITIQVIISLNSLTNVALPLFPFPRLFIYF